MIIKIGLVASYVAMEKQLQFLCTDRTFSQLSDILIHRKYIVIMLKVITCLDISTIDCYFNFKGYKVLFYDP